MMIPSSANGSTLVFRYGGRLVSTGEYTTRQFYIVFIAIIFSGESAALFFTYGTSTFVYDRHTSRTLENCD
jgi:hypothetical protein